MKKYVFESEYDGAFVGTIKEGIEWASDNNLPITDVTIREVGDEKEFMDFISDEYK